MEHLNCSAVVPMGPAETNLLTQERNVRGMSASVHFKMDIYNSMKFDVYVINRQNMKFKIGRTASAAKGKLVFLKGFGLTSQARLDLKLNATSDDISNSKELSHLLEKWAKVPNNSPISPISTLDQFLYTVEEDALMRKKCFYLRDLDLVVCIDGHIQNHPYSHQAQLQNRYTEVKSEIRKEIGPGRRFFTWNLFIIDNARRIGPRWVNIHGHVFIVKAHLDPDSKDGFYVVRDKPVTDGHDQPVPTSDFKESEEELDFPIYKSYQEAYAANDTETMVKLRTLTQEREIKQIDLETRLARSKADSERLEDEIAQQVRKNQEAERAHERDMESIRETMRQERQKAEHERAKFENEKIKFEHEKATQQSKNAGETIKVIGAVLTGILGLLAIASKWLK